MATSAEPAAGAAAGAVAVEDFDEGGRPIGFTASCEEARRMILERRMSLMGKVTGQCEGLENMKPSAKVEYDGDKGYALVCFARREELLDHYGGVFRQQPAFANAVFYLPGLVADGFTTYRDISAFKVWNGFYAGCALESNLVKPGEEIGAFLFAANLKGEIQEKALVPYGQDLPEEEREKLNFALGPYRWDVRRIVIPPPKKAGVADIEFRSASRSRRGAVTAASTALTLGMFSFTPGYKGFKVGFEVVSPDKLKAFETIEARVLSVLENSFAKRSAGAVISFGERVPKEAVVERFRQWPKMESIVKNLKKANNDIGVASVNMVNHFLAAEYGCREPGQLVP